MSAPLAETPALYVVYLGGDPAPGRLGEDHEVVVVVAHGVKQARAAARAKWRGESKGHVDAVQVIRVVDGFEIRLEPSSLDDDVELDVTYEPDPSVES
ncbi:MAG: DUF1543 domain-containing protein [Acidimicrobiales bacterium]|jgi:hypothetical protein